MHWSLRSSFLLLLLMFACGKELPQLSDMDMKSWIEDKNGCNGVRANVIDPLNRQKDKLLALSEVELVSVLGRPDQNELYTRNQKFYYYYLEPGPDCPDPKPQPHRLMVRFNAMGLAQEVLVE